MGGNKKLFDLMKEYNLVELPTFKKYQHAAVKWYQRKHLAEMDGFPFTEIQPAKTMNEKKEQIKTQISDRANREIS